ncbi:hypothetical protein ASE92_08065 [Pedobacter sp. Leaf41]|uniref:DUF4153 domain-containing protein n=1 Tax=Pedobacter sp. Leaf41 TaxID=1736218 RepID=UPI00070389BB|nr:DUF4173 domain-containing protein [Pedobacter sp. Leaf41]KQN36081.1 hypothetical protein ASE92_08065 [Pedobacter sp. Leaf41]
MKTKPNYLLLATLIGGILFNLIFWSERLAFNLLIYSVFILSINFFNTEVAKTKKFKIYAIVHLLAAVMVVVNNSDLSLATYYISFLLFVGFSHYQSIRSVWVALMATALQIIAIPATAFRRLSDLQIGNFKFRPLLRPLKYIILPIIMVFIFIGIYSGANAIFEKYASELGDSIANVLTDVFGFIFKDLSFERFIHFGLGLALTGGLLITFYDRVFEKIELDLEENLHRKKSKSRIKTLWNEVAQVFMGRVISKKMALKTEYIVAVISFVALNFLLLMLNGIDIWWLWLGKGKQLAETNYAAELHDGTNALIFSIILAMAIIVYFFRGNLNFYSKSKTLKILAFAWMIQNFLLIISVFIRDAQYIEVYGLTYKRIGVIVFATLCIVGLSTVYLKIARQKTFFYLLKINGNIWYLLLLVFTMVNWDVVIVKYNLAHRETIAFDPDYLLSLSDKTLPIIDQHRRELDLSDGNFGSLAPRGTILIGATNDQLQLKLDQRIGFFKERYESVSWLSWNLQDWNTAEYFGIKK